MGTSERVATILKTLGYTPTILAKSTELSLYRARKILSGNCKIKCSELRKIVQAVGISSDVFIKGVTQ